MQIGSDQEEEEEEEEEESIEGDEWHVEQSIAESPTEGLTNQHPYGFALLHSGLGTKYEVELGEVAEVHNPDALPITRRRELREIREKEKFSDEHYLVDLMFTPEITKLRKFKLPVTKFNELTGTNREQMKNFSNREFLLDKAVQRRCYLSMIDILFGFLYDYRITNGTHCTETPWNISRLSSTLSWFDVFESINDVVRSCIRRSLTYPLFRHWELSMQVLKDVLRILELGKVGVLNCFLKIYSLFNKRDPYYLLNQLYIEEYCIWIQQAKEANIRNLIPVLSNALEKVQKNDVDFDIVELEAAGYSEQEEMEIGERENELSQGVSRMHL